MLDLFLFEGSKLHKTDSKHNNQCAKIFGARYMVNIYSQLVLIDSQAIYHKASLGGPHDIGDGIERSLAYFLDAFKMLEQGCLSSLAHPLYRIKLAHNLRLAAAVAVVGDTKPVGSTCFQRCSKILRAKSF